MNRYLKTASIIYLISATIFVGNYINENRGSPIQRSDTPPEIVVRGQRVEKEKGTIEIYCSLTRESKSMTIVVPYNTDLDKALKKGQSAMKGKPFKMKNGKSGNGKSKDGKDGTGKAKSGKKGKKGDGSGSLSWESNPYQIYKLPGPAPPTKE